MAYAATGSNPDDSLSNRLVDEMIDYKMLNAYLSQFSVFDFPQFMGPTRPLNIYVAAAIKVPRSVCPVLVVLEQSVYACFVRVSIVGII